MKTIVAYRVLLCLKGYTGQLSNNNEKLVVVCCDISHRTQSMEKGAKVFILLNEEDLLD